MHKDGGVGSAGACDDTYAFSGFHSQYQSALLSLLPAAGRGTPNWCRSSPMSKDTRACVASASVFAWWNCKYADLLLDIGAATAISERLHEASPHGVPSQDGFEIWPC